MLYTGAIHDILHKNAQNLQIYQTLTTPPPLKNPQHLFDKNHTEKSLLLLFY